MGLTLGLVCCFWGFSVDMIKSMFFHQVLHDADGMDGVFDLS